MFHFAMGANMGKDEFDLIRTYSVHVSRKIYHIYVMSSLSKMLGNIMNRRFDCPSPIWRNWKEPGAYLEDSQSSHDPSANKDARELIQFKFPNHARSGDSSVSAPHTEKANQHSWPLLQHRNTSLSTRFYLFYFRSTFAERKPLKTPEIDRTSTKSCCRFSPLEILCNLEGIATFRRYFK